MSDDPTRDSPSPHIPRWVPVSMLLIATGWLLFLCGMSGVPSFGTPSPSVKGATYTSPDGSATTQKGEK